MPHRACKSASKQTVEASPDIVCIGSYKPGQDSTIHILDSSPGTPFAAESNGNTVVKRVLRSNKRAAVKSAVEASLVKNPSDLFNENSTGTSSDQSGSESRGRSRSKRRRHKAGDNRSSEGSAQENSTCSGQPRSLSKEKSDSRKSSRSKSKEKSKSKERSRSKSSKSGRSRKRSSSKSPETSTHRRSERSRHAESKTEKGKRATSSDNESTAESSEGNVGRKVPSVCSSNKEIEKSKNKSGQTQNVNSDNMSGNKTVDVNENAKEQSGKNSNDGKGTKVASVKEGHASDVEEHGKGKDTNTNVVAPPGVGTKLNQAGPSKKTVAVHDGKSNQAGPTKKNISGHDAGAESGNSDSVRRSLRILKNQKAKSRSGNRKQPCIKNQGVLSIKNIEGYGVGVDKITKVTVALHDVGVNKRTNAGLPHGSGAKLNQPVATKKGHASDVGAHGSSAGKSTKVVAPSGAGTKSNQAGHTKKNVAGYDVGANKNTKVVAAPGAGSKPNQAVPTRKTVVHDVGTSKSTKVIVLPGVGTKPNQTNPSKQGHTGGVGAHGTGSGVDKNKKVTPDAGPKPNQAGLTKKIVPVHNVCANKSTSPGHAGTESKSNQAETTKKNTGNIDVHGTSSFNKSTEVDLPPSKRVKVDDASNTAVVKPISSNKEDESTSNSVKNNSQSIDVITGNGKRKSLTERILENQKTKISEPITHPPSTSNVHQYQSKISVVRPPVKGHQFLACHSPDAPVYTPHHPPFSRNQLNYHGRNWHNRQGGNWHSYQGGNWHNYQYPPPSYGGNWHHSAYWYNQTHNPQIRPNDQYWQARNNAYVPPIGLSNQYNYFNGNKSNRANMQQVHNNPNHGNLEQVQNYRGSRYQKSGSNAVNESVNLNAASGSNVASQFGNIRFEQRRFGHSYKR